jgi:hypothetical protein
MKNDNLNNFPNVISNLFLSIIIIILLSNLIHSLLLNSWQNKIDPAYSNTRFLVAYFGTMLFCLIWPLTKRIIRFSISKDGISAEVEKIESAKKEVLATQEEIRKLYKDILKSSVTLMENSRRWSGWTEKRLKKERQNIQEKVIELKLSKSEHNNIFETKIFWDKIARIEAIKKQIEPLIKDPKQQERLNAEWTTIVDESDKPDAKWLEKYLDQISLKEEDKNKLRDAIKGFDQIDFLCHE